MNRIENYSYIDFNSKFCNIEEYIVFPTELNVARRCRHNESKFQIDICTLDIENCNNYRIKLKCLARLDILFRNNLTAASVLKAMLKNCTRQIAQCVGSRIGRSQIKEFHCSRIISSDFSHVVIGGGVVGTAVGSELQAIEGNNVLLVEQHESLGTETTSRNSEVIHAGLYYPKDSLKAELCIKGKNKIYEAYETGKFNSIQVPLSKCGKWVVAQDETENEYLERLQRNAKELEVPTGFISTEQAKKRFPLIKASAGILESPTTGIISAHDLVLYFQTQFENNEGTIGLNTQLVDIEYNRSIPNYCLTLKEKDSGSEFEVTTDNLVNSAGLYAQEVSNFLLPEDRHLNSYFAKGTYYAYQPINPIKTSKITEKLIYPCPNPNASSLGTHLTFDLGGQLRFGPDLEWLDIKSASEIDYSATSINIDEAVKAIKTYFPSIEMGDIQPTYTGVRPKTVSQAENKQRFSDFIIREEKDFPGFVNLLGIESPGLTSSWAIAEYVKNIYYK
ncbi:DEHA2G21252p [Debaryomyces hansenii CBS767]|jgi:L-2-hydroxyglutarate oxidase LhgO|uniref:L-2-hydroxyglutarate dehydrogenase, mitochondrial n=1 Tax=Debaryomyces hansenii (strain ATCC 36239 / CBS 767 / BCRC 21394 / JCM 1990 / NBRC 0083 / IGC 2968) TaxID=284592 RepID=Q6BH54_DEBHA|nr:DEHA2G21252p [Debaryomyces hansenii CBS767]CAG90977.2 DEHA2G21252p [Debaryomyces hansenii CBS767]|eukprot:XP_462467.2 DEHA2G21252p [Debaryomyces hansenii CBS767]